MREKKREPYYRLQSINDNINKEDDNNEEINTDSNSNEYVKNLKNQKNHKLQKIIY